MGRWFVGWLVGWLAGWLTRGAPIGAGHPTRSLNWCTTQVEDEGVVTAVDPAGINDDGTLVECSRAAVELQYRTRRCRASGHVVDFWPLTIAHLFIDIQVGDLWVKLLPPWGSMCQNFIQKNT